MKTALAASALCALAGLLAPSLPAQALPAPVSPTGTAASVTSAGAIAAYTLVVPPDVSPSRLLARVVLPRGARCPDLVARVTGDDGGTRTIERHSMRRHIARTTGSAFTALAVCEARMPQRAVAARIGPMSIPAALPPRVRTIAMMGDTGCRINASGAQACTDPSAWPPARIAASIADDDPDVIVYLGDAFYREAACPNPALCANSPAPLPGLPFLDSDYGWLADALLPLAPMFAAAPVLPVRGNHELCYRGGNGWFLFLDPSWQNGSACAPDSAGVIPTVSDPTFAIDLPVSERRTLRLVVVDSSSGRDDTVSSAQAMLRPLYAEAHRLATEVDEAWLLTHRPITGIVTSTYAPTPLNGWTPWTSVDQQVASYRLLGGMDLLVGSHDHLVQGVQVPGLPGQLVLGNGGAMLDPPTGYAIPPYGPLANASGAPLTPEVTPYPRATSEWTKVAFGYAVATPGARQTWDISLRDADGRPTNACRLAGGELACQ